MEDEAPSPLPLHQEVAALRQRVAQLEAAAHYAATDCRDGSGPAPRAHA